MPMQAIDGIADMVFGGFKIVDGFVVGESFRQG